MSVTEWGEPFDLTAPKQAGFIGQTIQPPYGSITSLIYFMGTETQTSIYSVFAISTSPEIYNIGILQNPYLGSSLIPSRSATTPSERSLQQQAPYQSLMLSSTCFEASLSRRF